jgi:hypothetical protein
MGMRGRRKVPLISASGGSIFQAAEKRLSAALPGPLTLSAAWQQVAPYSSRRHPSPLPVSSTGQAHCGVHANTPRASGGPARRAGADLAGAPVNGNSQDSTRL